MKKTSITLLILFFLSFVFYQTQKSTEFNVLKIVSPTQIVVDKNQNNVEDEDETIVLDNIKSFNIKPDKAQAVIAKQLKISEEDAIGLGFLAENFAKETLEGKKVKLEKSSIVVDNKVYSKMLLESGLALKEGSSPSLELLKKVEKVRKLKLVILNNKNHKYHKLTCKYGILAHNSQLIPAMQLPKDAKPCKFCLVKHKEYKKYENLKKKSPKSAYYDEIPFIKSPSTSFESNSVKIFLSDMTKTLKPSNSCTTGICRALVEEINSAQTSIDFAIYGYTKVPAIQNALQNAQKRGVKIRFVYDLDKNGQNIYPDTNYLANLFTDSNHDLTDKLMHDKFFIFDGKTVLTGSANISNTDMSGFNSNAVTVIKSEKIAKIYSNEFEQMYVGKFHKKKSKTTDKADGDISVYFSPKDRAITCQVIPLIEGAQKYIYIPAFLITHKDLTQSLIDAHNRGVAVKVILDSTNTHSGASKLKILRESGIQVKTENFAGKLHSKSIIIDDCYTVIGSMNFSKSGENENDENLIIIKDRDVAIFYKTFFQYLWQRIPDKWLKLNARSESYDSIGSCNDAIDNDFDGKIDKNDDSCRAYQVLKKRKANHKN